jgi:hypothetical protein
MFTRLIDMRDEAKARKDPLQQQMKITANSTSYGIYVEVNRDDAPKPEALTLYDAGGHRFGDYVDCAGRARALFQSDAGFTDNRGRAINAGNG